MSKKKFYEKNSNDLKFKEVLKEWSGGLAITERGEDGKARMQEGPSYEYANYIKKIEKAENAQAKAVNDLVKLLKKKGLNTEATKLASNYMVNMRDFNQFLKYFYGTLT